MFIYIYIHTYKRVYVYIPIYIHPQTKNWQTARIFILWCVCVWVRACVCLCMSFFSECIYRVRKTHKLQIIFHKRATKYMYFCGKWPIKIRHPIGFRHSVPSSHLNCFFLENSVTMSTNSAPDVVTDMAQILIYLSAVRRYTNTCKCTCLYISLYTCM